MTDVTPIRLPAVPHRAASNGQSAQAWYSEHARHRVLKIALCMKTIRPYNPQLDGQNHQPFGLICYQLISNQALDLEISTR